MVAVPCAEVLPLVAPLVDQDALNACVDEILETSPELFRVREAASNIFSLSQTLLDEASHLANSFENLANGRTLDTVGGYVLGLLALAAVIRGKGASGGED